MRTIIINLTRVVNLIDMQTPHVTLCSFVSISCPKWFKSCIQPNCTKWPLRTSNSDESWKVPLKVTCYTPHAVPSKCARPGNYHDDVMKWKHFLYKVCQTWALSWWRHEMKTFSALLALSEGNSPVTGEFPSQRPVTRSFDVFYLRRKKRLSKQSRRRWFESPSCSSWRDHNGLGNMSISWMLNGTRPRGEHLICHANLILSPSIEDSISLQGQHCSRLHKYVNQATGLDPWASRVKCPARFVSHLHEICIYLWFVYSHLILLLFVHYCNLMVCVVFWVGKWQSRGSTGMFGNLLAIYHIMLQFIQNHSRFVMLMIWK